MFNLRFILLLLTAWIPLSAQAEVRDYDPDIFSSPLNIPLNLSGTFGELRGSHFHAGYDFRTYGRKGFEVNAAASGYVSRISVSPTGYGNALYITHPNGLKTVYAHLHSFIPEIKELVRKEQFRRESFSVRIHPERHTLQVKRGQKIGLSGNSGSSGGPHLHFEVRKAATQEPINPALFNFPVEDNHPPEIRAVQLHPLTENTIIRARYRNGRTVTRQFRPLLIKASKVDGNYILSNIEKLLVSGPVGISVEAIDYQYPGQNKLGVKSIRLLKDDELYYSHSKEKFAFSQTRYIKAHVDQAMYLQTNRSFQRLFLLPHNRLPFYKTVLNNGHIYLSDGEKSQFVCIANDGFNNESRITFTLEGADIPVQGDQFRKHYVKMFPWQRINYYRDENIHLTFPKNSFYDTVYFQYNNEPPYEKAFSERHYIHERETPLHKFFSIAIRPKGLPGELKDRAFIARIDDNEKIHYHGGSYSNGKIRSRSREFGSYEIRVDTTAPEIKPLNFASGSRLPKERDLQIEISDDISGIDSYVPKINGRWVLMEYDPKNDLLTMPSDQHFPEGNLRLTLKVKDRAGNTATFEALLDNQ